MSERKTRERAAPPAIYLVAGMLAAIAGFGLVYVNFAPSDNGKTADDAGTAAGEGGTAGDEEVAVSPLNGLNTGAMAAFLVRPKPLDLPDFSFAGGNGETKSLGDFKGKVVLLNIWATWCVPCREEMPAFDRLETELGGETFQIVAVNVDKGGPDKAEKFLKETGATHLQLYTDPTGKLFRALEAVGMPTTLFIGRDGKEMGRLVGPADWASPEAKRLIEAAMSANANKASASVGR